MTSTRCFERCRVCVANWRRDRLLTKLGAFYLAAERGEQPPVPSRSELLSGCCKHGAEADGQVRAIALGPWAVADRVRFGNYYCRNKTEKRHRSREIRQLSPW
jgi:hypothetical protein